MLGHIAVIALEGIGTLIPIIAIIILLNKGQGKSNSLLVMANFGALMMNWGYLNLLQAKEYQEALSIYQFEYIGSVIFYLFFILFVKSFLLKDKKSKLFTLSFIILVCIEGTTLYAVAYRQSWVYENVDMSYFDDGGRLYQKASDVVNETPPPKPEDEDDTASSDDASSKVSEGNAVQPSDDNIAPSPSGTTPPPDAQTSPSGSTPPSDPGKEPAGSTPPPERNGTLTEIDKDGSIDSTSGKGYMFVNITHGPLFMIRYSYLAFLLFVSLLCSCISFYKNKVVEERKKLAYLMGTETVILGSLLVGLLYEGAFNWIPILVSSSVLVIICGTASGNFYTVADRGRGRVLEQADAIFVIVDNNYRFLDASDYARKMFPELAKMPVYKELPDDLKETLTGEKMEFEFEGRRYTRRTAPIEMRRHRKCKVIGYSIMLVDMTDVYNLMDQLEEEKQKAIDANEAKSNFMSNMSHEIRTPMNAIVGMTDIMLRHGQDEFNTEYLNNIKSSGAALLTVINDILDFSKIESGKLEIIPDEYEIMSVLNDLGMIFLNRIGDKPIELIYDIDPKMPHKLNGDAGRIRQILLNIVNNGIKYTDSGYVKLTIRLRDAGDGAVYLDCAVEDSGIGIKEEDLSKLFSTFSQVDTKRNRGKEGTGLGLSIAKQLVEAMGGAISVESTYGQGSTFSFSMKQEVVDSKAAASINSDKRIIVSGLLQNTESLKMLEKLCSYYENVEFIDAIEAYNDHVEPDFFFVEPKAAMADEISGDMVETLKKSRTEVIALNNPMIEDSSISGLTMMNKPLYTLNFCMALNHEMLTSAGTQDRIYNFTAPDASILVVDDNEMNRKVALGLMEPYAMKVDTANDGKQAVEMVLNGRYDIVFMDHMMPIMDGIEATEAIRNNDSDYCRNLCIVALSANALSEARTQFKEAGMNDFLAKPIKTKELYKMLLKYLPPEKVIKSEETVKPSEDNKEELPVIEGLDVAAGVENSGGLKLFTSLLGDFYKLIDRKSNKIEKCLNDGMIRDYTIEVHALKNTARMIGALKLSDMFYDLEKAGNAEDMDTINKLTPETIRLYKSYKTVLEPYAAVNNDEKTDIETDEIIKTLEDLKNAMDGFDLDGADAAMKKLDAAKMPETIRSMIDDLSAYVADVAMEDVMNLCDSIVAKLNES